MKFSEKKKPVSTVPKGVWEGSRPLQKQEKPTAAPSTDMQGNGYPARRQSK